MNLCNPVKMWKTVCRICLRSDFQRADDIYIKLFDFYDELCDFDALHNDKLTFCKICEHLLRKFYNFRLRCHRAHKILKTNRRKGIDKLQSLLPPSCIGFASQSDNQIVIVFPMSDEDHTENNELQNEELKEMEIKTEDIDDPISEDIKFDLEDDIVKQKDISKPDDFATSYLQTDSTNTNQNYLINNDNIVLRSDEIILTNEEKMLENDEVLQNDEIKLENNEMMLENDEVLQNDEIMLENDELIEKDEMMLENDELLQNDEMVMLSDEKILKNDEIMIENDEMILKNDELLQNDKLITKEEEIIDDQLNDADNVDSDDEEIPKIINKKVPKKALKPKKIVRPKKALKRKLDEQIEMDDVVSVRDLQNIDTTQQQEMILQKQLTKLKEKVINILELGTLDLGDHVKMTKDTFLDMLDKCDKALLPRILRGMFRNDSRCVQKIKKFLLNLWKHFDPQYETVFRIEYLTTHEQKLAEFKARSKSEEYLKAEFKCDICYKTFEALGQLEYHSKTMHDESRGHACEICSMRFGSRANVYAHGRKNHYTVYRCKECRVILYSFEVMRHHYDKHKGKTYTCDICQKQFKSFTCYKTHKSQAHGTRVCPRCNKKFVSTLGLDNHLKKEQCGTVAKMSCDECGAEYRTRTALINHIQKHHNTQMFKCEEEGCSAQFLTETARLRHATDSGHAAPCAVRKPPYWTCSVCGGRVANTHRLSMFLHYKEAHPDAPYGPQNCTLCELCGKAIQQTFFRDHMNKHTGAKPYDCSECGERFHMARDRDSHRLRHFPPNHKCEFCGKMFRTLPNLYNHKRAHIGDRRYKCNICSKGFLHSGALNEHIRGVHHHIRRVKTTRNTEDSDSKTTRKTASSGSKTTRKTASSGSKTTRKTASSDSKTTRKTASSGSKTTRKTASSGSKTSRKTASSGSKTTRKTASSGSKTTRKTASSGSKTTRKTASSGSKTTRKTTAEAVVLRVVLEDIKSLNV